MAGYAAVDRPVRKIERPSTTYTFEGSSLRAALHALMRCVDRDEIDCEAITGINISADVTGPGSILEVTVERYG